MYDELIRDLRDPNKSVDRNKVADTIEELLKENKLMQWKVDRLYEAAKIAARDIKHGMAGEARR